MIGCSVDSPFSHLAFSNTPRNKGGLGGCQYPLLADLSKSIGRDYGVLIEDGPDAGITFRCAINRYLVSEACCALLALTTHLILIQPRNLPRGSVRDAFITAYCL